MGHLYTLAPHQQPHWRFTSDDFTARLRRRWPRSRMDLGDGPGSPPLLRALVPFDAPRELGIALLEDGWTVTLDPADPATAAEFTLWYVGQLPTLEPPVYLTAGDKTAGPLALHPDIRHDELLAELVPLHIPRPDPPAVGRAAAEILDRVLNSEEYPPLAHDVLLQRHRWATFTGLPLIARLDLDRDGEPLLREALRTLALRAAVYEISGSDDTAATLAVPAPIDDMVRVVLAEHTLCTQISRRLGIRFVRMLTAWDHFGWRPLDYTHQCYLHAGWELNERYWIDADETARRLKTLNGRYFDIGIQSAGRHTIRFERLPDPSMVAI